jgi:hypothetical protein
MIGENMHPNPNFLIKKAGIILPLIGFYDTPDPLAFEPLVRPVEGRWACLYMFYKNWLKGKALHLTEDNYGCGGAGTYLFGVKTRSRQEYIDFLYGEEGLKASGELIGQWFDQAPTYKSEHPNIIVGQLKDDQFGYLKTVTFFINPDQLSLFIAGAYYHQALSSPPLVTAPFGAGCGLLSPLFDDLESPKAIIGATDVAMRQFLPPDVLAFTVTKSMYEHLCSLDENSFLDKPFWKDLKKARSRS